MLVVLLLVLLASVLLAQVVLVLVLALVRVGTCTDRGCASDLPHCVRQNGNAGMSNGMREAMHLRAKRCERGGVAQTP